jgi:hypothetical protein
MTTGIAAAILVVGSTAPALAGPPVVSNARIQLSGDVRLPDSEDLVTLSGLLHVVTRVVPVDDGHLITVYANLPANVDATGPEELRFIAHGASKHADVHDLSDGEIVPCVMPGFTLLLAGPSDRNISPVSFDITVHLQFSASGELLAGIADTGGIRSEH